MTISIKSLSTRRLLKRYSYAFAMKVKRLYSYIHNDWNHVILYLCVRILIGSILHQLKVISALLFEQMIKMVLYILFIIFVVCTVMHLHYINRADQYYYMPIVPLKRIRVSLFLLNRDLCPVCHFDWTRSSHLFQVVQCLYDYWFKSCSVFFNESRILRCPDCMRGLPTVSVW